MLLSEFVHLVFFLNDAIDLRNEPFLFVEQALHFTKVLGVIDFGPRPLLGRSGLLLKGSQIVDFFFEPVNFVVKLNSFGLTDLVIAVLPVDLIDGDFQLLVQGCYFFGEVF